MLRAPLWLVTVLLGMTIPVPAHAQALADLSDDDVAHGKRLYEGRCARCHGMQGHGGEGPALARPYLTYARDDATLVGVIRGGIPNTGMIGDWSISSFEAQKVAAYVRTLSRTTTAEPVTGDAARGEQLFHERGGCTACHGQNGVGTQFGPELVRVGARRNLSFIRESMVDPGTALPEGGGFHPSGFAQYLPVQAGRREDGKTVSGYRVNESSFAILVRDQAGRIHSFDKDELEMLVKQFGQSLMPNYRDVFTDDELDDIVAYLISLRELRP